MATKCCEVRFCVKKGRQTTEGTLAIPRFDSDYSWKFILVEFILEVAKIYRRRCLESSGQRLSYVSLVHKEVSGTKISTSNLLLIRWSFDHHIQNRSPKTRVSNSTRQLKSKGTIEDRKFQCETHSTVHYHPSVNVF